MATLKDYGNRYVERLRSTRDYKREFDNILYEINNLVYTESNNNISDSDKKELIIIILDYFNSIYKSANEGRSRGGISTYSNNENYLDLIEYITNQTKGK